MVLFDKSRKNVGNRKRQKTLFWFCEITVKLYTDKTKKRPSLSFLASYQSSVIMSYACCQSCCFACSCTKRTSQFYTKAYSALFGTQSYVFRLNFVIQPVKLQRKQFFFKRTRSDVHGEEKPACLYWFYI